MTNAEYIDELVRDVGRRVPKFRLGQMVESDGLVGVVDVVYANFASAVNAFAVPEGWFELQEPALKTPKTGFFYGVTLFGSGALLSGEDDLEEST